MININQIRVFTILIAASAAGVSAEPLVTDRPDATESSSVMSPSVFQLEIGLTASDDGVGGTAYESAGTLLRVGIVEDWELRLGWGGYLDSDAVSGANDAMIGFKYYIAEETGLRPKMAILVHTSVPIGDRDLTSDQFDPDFLLSFSHTLSERLSLGYNFGAALETGEDVNGDTHTLGSGLYSVALGYSVTDQLGAFIEVFGAVGLSAEESPASIDGGFTWLFNDDSQLDLFAGFGLNDEADDWFVGMGYSIRWGN